eukprot:CAMPEP_0174730112 /NCGR_PEP_ID=MMETSP1094-20130205/54943_1 /TAXON_ID=156173 /ORGANISM="Chrysochromulina brevifilum, Strain UTEX LB 985" /LENGTH=93 /DNA_ID=CAMNT_0015932323 /DNA_START=82 /DNA_END=359 /DNA_ORIENTATION=+
MPPCGTSACPAIKYEPCTRLLCRPRPAVKSSRCIAALAFKKRNMHRPAAVAVRPHHASPLPRPSLASTSLRKLSSTPDTHMHMHMRMLPLWTL